jgi:N6-L-threonylcarbamoyladenine synthase
VEAYGRYRRVGSTRDDAAGEAYDKVARLLGLPYPGGLPIDRLAQTGDPRAIRFPRALNVPGVYDWSFSGLKTAVRNHVRGHGVPEGQALADLCASFQEAVADSLSRKVVAAARGAPPRRRGALRRGGGQLAAPGRSPWSARASGTSGCTCRRRRSAPTTGR